MLYFIGFFLFSENNILCNVHTKIVHETYFLLKITEQNLGYQFILGCLDHFGLALYNERDNSCQNATTHSPCVANHFGTLVVVNSHCTYEVISNIFWSASVLGWNHIFGWKIMYWCLRGVHGYFRLFRVLISTDNTLKRQRIPFTNIHCFQHNHIIYHNTSCEIEINTSTSWIHKHHHPKHWYQHSPFNR